jgi:hypothetical protein
MGIRHERYGLFTKCVEDCSQRGHGSGNRGTAGERRRLAAQDGFMRYSVEET